MMNLEQRKTVGVTLSYLCEYYNKTLSKPALSMMVEDLSDLPFEEVMKAIQSVRRDPKITQFPLPAKIREIINPTQSLDGIANETASRIRAAITKFGWPNPEDAKSYIGDLGWKIVERAGGWMYVCENHGLDLNPLTFHAQARDQAKALVETYNTDGYDQPLMLDKINTPKLFENIVKLKSLKDI